MASYDALRHLSIGQYVPTDSAIHRLDPRSKLVAAILALIASVMATRYASSLILVALAILLVRASRLPLRFVLASVRPALPIMAVLSVLQLFFYAGPPGKVWVAWGPLEISSGATRMVVVSLLRFVNLLCLTSLLTNTTTASSLTQGMESLLRPLSALGLPGHELSLVGAIALRFLPILGEQLESIIQAQRSRGILTESNRWAFVVNARRVAQLIIPLLVDAYRRAEELILAMRARCYRGGQGRTHLAQLVFTTRDMAAIALGAISIVATLALQRLPLP